jgi:hypothetical protein
MTFDELKIHHWVVVKLKREECPPLMFEMLLPDVQEEEFLGFIITFSREDITLRFDDPNGTFFQFRSDISIISRARKSI